MADQNSVAKYWSTMASTSICARPALNVSRSRLPSSSSVKHRKSVFSSGRSLKRIDLGFVLQLDLRRGDSQHQLVDHGRVDALAEQLLQIGQIVVRRNRRNPAGAGLLVELVRVGIAEHGADLQLLLAEVVDGLPGDRVVDILGEAERPVPDRIGGDEPSTCRQ
ncbi:MAG: hypothetical protein R3D25_15350 [Geminicoccaceae bacterium]